MTWAMRSRSEFSSNVNRRVMDSAFAFRLPCFAKSWYRFDGNSKFTCESNEKKQQKVKNWWTFIISVENLLLRRCGCHVEQLRCMFFRLDLFRAHKKIHRPDIFEVALDYPSRQRELPFFVELVKISGLFIFQISKEPNL